MVTKPLIEVQSVVDGEFPLSKIMGSALRPFADLADLPPACGFPKLAVVGEALYVYSPIGGSLTADMSVATRQAIGWCPMASSPS